jgi:hypothetical protein
MKPLAVDGQGIGPIQLSRERLVRLEIGRADRRE